MRKYKLILVAGARPNFMKIAPIFRALRTHRDQRSEIRGQISEEEDGKGQRPEVREQRSEG